MPCGDASFFRSLHTRNAPHAWATLTPNSVAQGGRAARSGNISAPFRSPRVPRRTLGEHFCPIPSPNGAFPHARGTLRPLSAAQRCRVARSGNISGTIRRPTVPRSTLREHFCHYPSPDGVSQHARGTFLNLSVAQRCRAARSGDTYARFRRRGGRGKGNGRKGRSMGDGREAGPGRSLGRGWCLGPGLVSGAGAGKGKGTGTGTGTNRVGGKH